jgi:amino acid transporter
MFCAISISCAASRATWAFARDAAIPFHNTFATVNKTLSGGIPLNAILLSTVIQLLLGLIYLGSSAAFNAFVGVAVMCLGSSYAMPVAISLANQRKDMADSPFPLGYAGTPLNAIAVVWAMFELVLFSMPAVLPTTPTTMSMFLIRGSLLRGWVEFANRLRIGGFRRVCIHQCSLVFH